MVQAVSKQVDEAKDKDNAAICQQAPLTKCEILWVSSASASRAAQEIRERVDAERDAALGGSMDADAAEFSARVRLALRNWGKDYAEAAAKDRADFNDQKCRAE